MFEISKEKNKRIEELKMNCLLAKVNRWIYLEGKMKLEVGMYVRTDRGKIGKFRRETPPYIELEYKNNWCDLIFLNRITKASYNIIDLIELDDVLVVRGVKYTVLQNEKYFEGKLYIERITTEGMPRFTAIIHLFYENKVESILTKEQFDSIKYEVE